MTGGPAVTVATDGSCLRNPGGPTGWAWACEDGTWLFQGTPTGTNQTGELYGLIAALRDFADVPLIVQTDSAYVIGCAETWARGWERRGWKTADGKPVANLRLVQQIAQLKADRTQPLRLVKVKGHAQPGTWPLNERADQLARQGATTSQTTRRACQARG